MIFGLLSSQMEFRIKNRHRLKNKDIKNFEKQLNNNYSNIIFPNKAVVEIGDLNVTKIILVDNEICFFYYKDRLVFTLRGIVKFNPKEKYVIVDMGAVKFVTNGADVMSPGIVDADENIEKEDIVWVCDQRNRKAIAVGIAFLSGKEMILKNKGKAIKIVHYVGDELWNFVAKSL